MSFLVKMFSKTKPEAKQASVAAAPAATEISLKQPAVVISEVSAPPPHASAAYAEMMQRINAALIQLDARTAESEKQSVQTETQVSVHHCAHLCRCTTSCF